MSYYQEWLDRTSESADPVVREAFIKKYYAEEQEAYDRILQAWPEPFAGTSAELSVRLGFSEGPIFAGFISGANPSLRVPVDVDTVDHATSIRLDIDFDVLFWNMLEAKATWLHQLPSWDSVMDAEKREETIRRFRASKTARSEKVGRNDPCPCGSGKKHKNCHGRV